MTAGSYYKFRTTWHEFVRALKSPNDPFNPFPWILRLTRDAFADFWRWTGTWSRVSLLSWIPLFAMGLVLLVVLSYFGSLRTVVRERWCFCSSRDGGDSHDCTITSQRHRTCRWMPVHDAIVVYLGTMILFHYLHASCTSPGVALPENATNNSAPWRSEDGQGGFPGWQPVLDVTEERGRVALYGKLVEEATSDIKIFPSPFASYCSKCNIQRPPRCHHCRQCKRCVLQFDHHCAWMNNCIGYNN